VENSIDIMSAQPRDILVSFSISVTLFPVPGLLSWLQMRLAIKSLLAFIRHWAEGATCIRQGSRHIGHWPTV